MKALELADAYADAVAAHRLESLYGTSKSYTLEKAKERDEAFEALAAELRRLAAVEAERDEMRAELDGRYKSIIEMGNMLTEIVNLIRGEPEEGTSHSTHDAVELVRGLAMHNDQYAIASANEVAKLKAELEIIKASPVHQFRKARCADWFDGHPDHTDGGGPYETRTLYALGSKTHD